MEWHRWREGADGASPSTCTHCKAARKSSERCDGCIEPVLWVGNVAVATLYIAMQTQWLRNDYNGHRVGLRYESIETVARYHEIEVTPELFDHLQGLEIAAINMDANKS